MTNHDNPDNKASGGKQSQATGDSIARLMRLAGPRPAIPGDVQDRVHDRVRKEWQGTLVRRRTFRWSLPVVLAAAVVLAVALYTREPEVQLAPIATIALVEGPSSMSGYPLSPGERVYPGDLIETGSRGVALRVNNGLSLRLAAGTNATLGSIDELTIRSGKIYADTGASTGEDVSITVHTRIGSATDTGTRFAVSYLGGKMSVAVREGRVDVSDQRTSYIAEAGERVTLQPNEEAVYEGVASYDPSWDWASALAPVFDIENRSALEFLEWAARETGRELVFESDRVRFAAMGTRLHGSVAGFTPAEAIDTVLPTTRFEHRLDDGNLIVGYRTP